MIIKNNLPKVLVCDDDKNIHLAIKASLGKEYDIKSAYNGDEAVVILKNNHMDLVLLDMEMRNNSEGLETIPKLLEQQNDLPIIFFSGQTDFNYVRDAMKLGASDYIAKDAGAEEVRHVFQKTLEIKKLKNKNNQTQFEVKKNHQKSNTIIGNSPAIDKLKKQIERAKNSTAPILIFGETGAGKEVVARNLRKTKEDGTLEPFVAVDAGTIQSSVAESVLFGYEKGAFTGAEKTTRGLFEEADGGCIYFDELANMPLEIQNKLLRVLQEKEVLRIGSSKPIQLDFRVITATNQNLEKLVAEGKFKEDLFQRLNVLQLEIPSLKNHSEDIELLLNHFSEVHRNGLEKLIFLPETIEVIKRYPFPGNVRELSNLVVYLYSMCETNEISPLDLPPKFQVIETENMNVSASTEQTSHPKNFYKAVEKFEKDFLSKEYKTLEGNISKIAAELGMDRSYLHSKLKNYGIHSIKK